MEIQQIYDLQKDPGEKDNLIDEELIQTGRKHFESYKQLEAAAGAKRELDAKTIEKLRALGYLDADAASH